MRDSNQKSSENPGPSPFFDEAVIVTLYKDPGRRPNKVVDLDEL
jgi:hypothetical protein